MSTRSRSARVLACVLAALLALPAPGLATNVSLTPLRPDLQAKPNVILGIDESGSMDGEISLLTNDGTLWWDFEAGSGWGIDPQHPVTTLRGRVAPWFNLPGGASDAWRQYAYLFPNGLGEGNRLYGDGPYTAFAVLPTVQFAFLRAAAYNPVYYNPAYTYRPWPAATTAAGPVAPTDARPTAARSHPLKPAADATTLDLSAVRALDARDHFVFTALPGMTIPAGSQKKVCDRAGAKCGEWLAVGAAERAPAASVVRVALPYRPATYWMRERCTPEQRDPMADRCARAPDGSTLRRYEIVRGQTFPSGRSYEAELQNFANWFQYYRKRSHMLTAAMGQVLLTQQGKRIGAVFFNALADATLLDMDSGDPATDGRRVLGTVYDMVVRGSTPTRRVLDFIGRQYARPGVITSACQRNHVFVVTDGYADLSAVTPPPWDAGKSASTWGAGSPYQTTYEGSLADLALRYFTNNPRPDLRSGMVLPTPRDPNRDLHVNTYALSIAARGTLFQSENTPLPADWPQQLSARSPIAVDDLWHATVNGRGLMYLADDVVQTAQRVAAGFQDMASATASQSPIAVSSVNLARSDGRAYRAVYDPGTWAGDVTASPLDIATGRVADRLLWSLAATLGAKDWRTRGIASFNGRAGVPFTMAGIGSTMPGASPALIDYLRGSRAGEGDPWRTRAALVGGTVNARPVVSAAKGVVYAATGEGLLHAIDSASGQELWAYAPGAVLPRLAAAAQPTTPFVPLLDGSPVLWTQGATERLYAGLGNSGTGFYALDVSQPRSTGDAAAAARVLWEFPNAGTPAAVRSQLGLSVGRPLAVKTRQHGDVVLLTSGYNAPARDGRGRVFMLNARSGALIKTFAADAGPSGTDPGLAQIAGLAEDDGSVRYVYGGDEAGNVWRFDLEATSDGVMLLAQLRDAGGRPQPVTTAPELARVEGANVVYVGTGRLLAASDFGSTAVQSFYALKDDGRPLGDVRSENRLQERRLSSETNGSLVPADDRPFSWKSMSGWRFDLPAGQQVNTEPVIAYGAVSFVTNRAELTTCATGSWLYTADAASGLNASGRDTAVEQVSLLMSSGVVVLAVAPGSSGGGRTVGDMTTADNRVVQKDLRSVPPVQPRKNAWKQVPRQ